MTAAGVSVVIPVFNGERYLAEALSSVAGQTCPPQEIIVIDDGSRDGSAAIAKAFPGVRCVAQDHRGQSAARNRGAEAARGEYLAFLDADDLWVEDKLERQQTVLSHNPEVDVVFGWAEPFIDRPSVGGAPPRGVAPPMPAPLPGAMLIRRAAFMRIGGYRTDWRVAEVVEWYARAIDAGLAMRMLDAVVLRRRLHDANLGRRERESRTDYVRALRMVLARRGDRPPIPDAKCSAESIDLPGGAVGAPVTRKT
jgi:glycosyltransferase involved in cell wall biosynthesis